MIALSIHCILHDRQPSIFRHLGRLVVRLAKRVPVTRTLDGYERIAKVYEAWSIRSATPYAAEYWASHARAIREMIDDQRAAAKVKSV